jgi:short-subunit dehydrogenase
MIGYRTALVTGASSGLGEAFCERLAAAGCDLVLVARRRERLASMAARLERCHGIGTEVLPADLTDPGGLAVVERRLAAARPAVDLLVNSAGIVGRIAPLGLQPADAGSGVIDVNVAATVRLTRAAVASMVELGGGGVLNVASISAFLPTPGGAVYSASKAFVTSFSQSVHGEVKWLGVHVTALCPGAVRTPIHRPAGRRGGRIGRVLEPDLVVRRGLEAVAAGRPVEIPGADYQLKAALARWAPAVTRNRAYRRWGVRAAEALAAARAG